MSTSSNSSMKTWPRPPEAVVRNHGLEADIVTSKTEANPGRRFYHCQVWKHDDCKFFRWIDPSMSPNQEYCVQKWKMERDSMEEALQRRVVMQDILEDEVRAKNDEIEALQHDVNNLRCTNRYLKMAIVFLCVVIWLVI